jgi:hypothetical protein
MWVISVFSCDRRSAHRGQDVRDLVAKGLRVFPASGDGQAPVIGVPD